MLNPFDKSEIERVCSRVHSRSNERAGLLCQGGKGESADAIVALLPEADVFVDCFGGGGAVSVAALRSGKYKRVVYNELQFVPFNAFESAITGRYSNVTIPFIDKYTYQRVLDGRIRFCFSYNGIWWRYGYTLWQLPYLHACHHFIQEDDASYLDKVLPQLSESAHILKELCPSKDAMRCALQVTISNWLGLQGKFGKNWRINQNSFRLLHLERDKRFTKTFEVCKSSEAAISCVNGDYFTSLEHVKDGEKAVIYCDPPYKGAGGYNDVTFDYERFYNWIRCQKYPVFLSEGSEFPEFDQLALFTNRGQVCYEKKPRRIDYLYEVKSA